MDQQFLDVSSTEEAIKVFALKLKYIRTTSKMFFLQDHGVYFRTFSLFITGEIILSQEINNELLKSYTALRCQKNSRHSLAILMMTLALIVFFSKRLD